MKRQLRYIFLIYCLLISTSNGQSGGCSNNNWYIIQSTASGLVADATNPASVQLQPLTSNPSGLWRFQATNQPGVYYVYNGLTGTVLTAPDISTVNVDVLTGSPNQQWMYNSNGRLHNVGLNRVLNVPNANYAAGQPLDTWDDTGNPSQAFTVVQL